MLIATLQFTPVLGDVQSSIARAESLLYKDESRLTGLDLLVLPELAFTGYNFPSLAAISPHLESTSSGPSTTWARKTAARLNCIVAVGYPEKSSSDNFNYNALVFVDPNGSIIAHYRKSFLYYTDEEWASEGHGFHSGELTLKSTGTFGMDAEGKTVKIAAGICMDINPYKFQSPWTLFEFGNHVKDTNARLVVVSMAWLTHASSEELQSAPMSPDLGTFWYWIERFKPILGPDGLEEEVIVVLANRTGEEGMAAKIGEVRYAGSSCVLGMKKADAGSSPIGQVRIWDILGRAEEAILIVDTDDEPKYRLGERRSSPENDGTEDDDIEDDDISHGSDS